jgi:ABC-type Fe3+-hydroxamate transport system substrate-binding protein
MDEFENAGMSSVWTDKGGVTHQPGAAHARVVSLVPSLTETFCAVGGRLRLVGCTAFCIQPPDLLKDARVTKIGGTKTILRERVMALNPDLLLVNLEENILEDIDFFKSRVECYVNGVKTLKDGIASIRELGALAGEDAKAETLALAAETELSNVRDKAAKKLERAGRPRIFYAIWREPWMTINADTFVHDQLTVCGAENVFGADHSSRYPQVTLQAIRAAAPDVIWLPSEPYRFKEKHLAEFVALTDVPAVRQGRVELVNGDNVCWFGVRQIEGMVYTFERLWEKRASNAPATSVL